MPADASYSPSDIRILGIEDTDEAYDALNSALAVNFNTIHAVRKGKTVRSAEKQTPITPVAISQFRARGSQGPRSHQPDPGPGGGPAVCRHLVAAVHRAGRRQHRRRWVRPKSSRTACSRSTFTASRAPFRKSSPACSLARTTTSPTKSSLRSAGIAWAGLSVWRSRCRSRTRCYPEHGLAGSIHLEEGSGGRPRQPLHGPRACPVAAPLRAPCRSAPPRRRHPLQDGHLFRRSHPHRLPRGHLRAWASALRDRAHKQRRCDALSTAQGHPVRVVAGGARIAGPLLCKYLELRTQLSTLISHEIFCA